MDKDKTDHQETRAFSAIKRWLPLVILALTMGVAYALGLHESLSFEAFQNHKDDLQNAVFERPVLSSLAFMGLYTLSVALSLPVATVLTLAGGFLFGLWLGTLYVVISATLGASIIFLIAKTSFGSALRERAGGLYDRVAENMNENATGYLLFMRLVPIFPFVAVNVLPALFNVRLSVFVLTTFFGIIPGSFVYVNLGQQLGEIASLKDLVSTETLLSFALLGVFALIPTLYKNFKKKGARKDASKKAAVFLTVCALGTPSLAHATSYDQFLNLYDGLLAEHTVASSKNGIGYVGVDYDAWNKDQRHAQALSIITATDPAQFKTQDQRMAFWINAYNFLTIDLIVREGQPDSIRDLGTFFQNVWKRYHWIINGQKYTLDQIEHKILRPMGDARIHFAINCASVSCPDLLNVAYRAETLDEQLEAQTKKALQQSDKVLRIDGNTLRLSKIFEWFEEDYKDGDIQGWLRDYMDLDQDLRIRYMDYNWSLNRAH